MIPSCYHALAFVFFYDIFTSCLNFPCVCTSESLIEDTPRSINGVHVVVSISMAGLAIDKRSSQPLNYVPSSYV